MVGLIGLALEGGGARGAFHMGVIKAFLEEGYDIGGVTGTSIGALNGAVLVQGAFEEGFRIWENLTPSQLFDIDDEEYRKLIRRDFDRETALQFAARIGGIIRNKGIDTSRLKQFLQGIIDEDKIRQSPMDFGLVTISLSGLKPLELYKEDIPKGQMIDYLMASANFPGFRLKEIENKYYIDGGLYDNCPINLLARKGYREIYAVRTLGIGMFRHIRYSDVKVTQILPSEPLGRIFDFSRDLIRRNLKMGYYDGLRVIRGLKGRKYCIKPVEEELMLRALYRVPEEQIGHLASLFGLGQTGTRRMLLVKILPEIGGKLGLKDDADFQDIVINLLERLAEEQALPRYQIYEMKDFLTAIRERNMPETSEAAGITAAIRNRITESLTGKHRLLEAARMIAENLMLD
ncbi:MAG TPA: patatin-like phospholipase family protein [Thermoclostridium caenicola]|nr:patatin-like phospholipase family protein [Thermoclostridium caenicola]HOL83977.1 patatin-like phospholipase family protein [Thermoclostridium caenicola]HOP71985.1 patatin-like phospholipase family protein [Thermoclostridium caenicola]HPO76005.1 patatin-like phospholipase family protein [Thermoclostridium caenicola]